MPDKTGTSGADLEFGLSLGISPREPTSRIGSLSRRAEELGFDALWVIDSQLLMSDVYVCLAVAACSTTTLKLGTGVTNPLTRHITVTVNAASTLAELSEGRFILGLGSGDSAVQPLGLEPMRLGELRAYMTHLRGLLGGSDTEIDGRAIRMRRVRSDVPIALAASQPGMTRLAGEMADGVIVMGVATPDVIRLQLEWLSEGLERSGRRREDVFVDYWATVSVREDEKLAIEDVKSWAAGQARWLAKWKEVPDALKEYTSDIRRASERYDFGEHLSVKARHSSEVSDAFARTAAVVGDVDTCAARLAAIRDLGVDRLTLTLLSGGRDERLGVLADLKDAVASMKSTGKHAEVAKGVNT
jgi:5,10-methylenetetrahydromethanopterin reductase